MGAKIVVELEGLDRVLNNLGSIGEEAVAGIEKQTAQLAADTQVAWRNATPSRTGRLRAGDTAESGGMQFSLLNGVVYYPFSDEGHMTPKGWHTRKGFRPAKRRSHVSGHMMTEKAVEFIEENILTYLSKFLDGA